MRLNDLRRNWERMGREDPLSAVCTTLRSKGGRWDTDDFFAYGADEVSKILGQLRRVQALQVRHALDFGCGVGRLTQALALEYPDAVVTGIDLSPSMIAHAQRFAKERHCAGCRFVVNDGPDLKMLADGSFDLVLAELTLLHMEPRYSLGYIREFMRVLRPGGMAIFEVPEPTRRQALREMIPAPLVAVGNKLRTIRRPMMEMYGLSRQQVLETVHEAGGHVLATYDRGSEHGQFADFRYFASNQLTGATTCDTRNPCAPYNV